MAEAKKTNRKSKSSKTQKRGADDHGQELVWIESEGEKLLKGMFDLFEKHVPVANRKAREDALRQAKKLLSEWDRVIEEQTRKLIERLNVPTRDELKEYERKIETAAQHLRKNMDEHLKRGLSRLDIATKTEVKEVVKAVDKLRKDVNKIVPPPPRKPKRKAARA